VLRLRDEENSDGDGGAKRGHDYNDAVVPVQPAAVPMWEAGPHDEHAAEHDDEGDVEGGHDCNNEAVVPVQPATFPLWEAGTHNEYDDE
jgi:hypothetical protein